MLAIEAALGEAVGSQPSILSLQRNSLETSVCHQYSDLEDRYSVLRHVRR